MPLSQGSGGNGPAGLALKAWARIHPTTGALLAGAGIASLSGTPGAGLTGTFTTPMADAAYITKVDYLVAGIPAPYITQTAAGFGLYTQTDQSGVVGSISPTFLHLSFYG
jgi:hypothetical protein